MQYDGEASAPHEDLVHSALIYGSDEGFMQAAVPFIEEGVEAGEPTLIAVQGQNVENLRGGPREASRRA